MVKINISEKGKTYKIETENESLIGSKIGDKISGKILKPELSDFELQITGISDKAGFPGKKNVSGEGLKKIITSFGFGMKKRPKKEGKKERNKNKPKGLRLKKTIRGNTISKEINQINIKVIKSGNKPLEQVFEKQEEKPEEKKEEKKQEVKEEAKAEEKRIEEKTEQKPAEENKEKKE